MSSGGAVASALNWLNLSTPCALLLARAKGCTLSPGPGGIIIAEGWTGRLPIAGAFTVGSVVFLRGPRSRAGKALLTHEARHSLQYAACLGLPFLPMYFAAAAWSVLRTGDPASLNPFERHAGLADGGYRQRPVRSLRSAAAAAIRRR
ncbi:eCIS core domain-containing protein [Arthrobacter zhaoguopingii]|uniref:eCIS core domain-containing protein n=1 Tax=Arthrobacter zhaoguopingii TaxID=2681491 RepID=UPI001356F435|nr:DUF4157 domain-containing protein [Arthrobacter zhaoguopingii]